MIPDRVVFSGLDLDPSEFLQPRKHTMHVYPSSWVRYQFALPQDVPGNLRLIERWIEKTLDGRYGSYLVFGARTTTVVVLFEKTTDAVMFRLQGGERAWIEDADL